ncbi:MAG: DUF455 domain-containing protein [Alphaproteobacteria bacterium CG_4_10_14_0_2_um_filter_63_37]|nr:MAG: hypothetical protein AUJ55_05315 [Proteobacteria bacterium CG1_02_64_396]PJA25966.1 MAG: DUF455 domain-containing protein [Alphaproteobacteria bacterium CG_4_10_14_0_2_um_filter_63_37]
MAVARAALSAADPDLKVALTLDGFAAWAQEDLPLGMDETEPTPEPGRPERPRIVPPGKVPRRTGGGQAKAARFHALVHIELTAIDLAWDALHRFRNLPRDYYDDWARIAKEEAEHFVLLRDHLRSMGCDYGDFDAHEGIWGMAVETVDDPLHRMAMIPRTLEARGLDVTPGMIARLEEQGDRAGAEALKVIYRDEIGHVAAGSRWFLFLCAQRGLDPEATFKSLVARFLRGGIRGPLNIAARLQGGFSSQELERLEVRG